MKFVCAAGVAFLVVIGSTSALHAQGTVKETPFYPLKVGTKWEYKAGDQRFTMRVTKHENLGEIPCAVVETVSDEKVVATEYIYVTEDGVYRASFNGQKADPPVCFLKLPPKKDEKPWTVSSKLGSETVKATFKMGQEDVTVPAATYKNAFTSESKDCKVNDTEFQFTYWFAEGVGMVKQIVRVGTKEIAIELEKFEAGK